MKFFHPLLFCLFIPIFALSQERFEIEGFIKDDSTNITLPGATILIKETGNGTSTDEQGHYSLELEKGTYHFRISFIGYKTRIKTVNVDKDKRLNFSLSPRSLTTKEVEIVGKNEDKNVESTQMSTVEMKVAKLEKLPAFMGEVDILKTIKLLPGVSSTGDGNSGLYVRGGGPDQNLVLLDDAVIYRPSHLFGFFSVFNSDAIEDVTLIKGGMPAKYGGRLASVLDVEMGNGNKKEIKGEGGLGLISSKLTVEGPIVKDKTSFILGGRRTYADVVSKPFIPEESVFKGSGYYFYDLNGKIHHRFSEDDLLSISGYYGRDKFTYRNKESDFTVNIPWGNTVITGQWKHLFHEDLILRTTAIFSDYDFQFGAEQSQFAFNLFSGIRDHNLKSDLKWYPNARHEVFAGVEYNYHIFTPTHFDAESGEINFDTGELKNIYAHEPAFYLSDKFSITEHLKIHPGIRFSSFHQVGPFKRFVQDEYDRVLDTITYEKGEPIVSYHGWEPRLNVRYRIPTSNSSVKASYTKNYQYIHLASISPVSLPTDVWLPSTSLVKPQIGTQYAGGYFRNFDKNTYETSIEVYYKEMKNLVEFRDGAVPENNIKNNIDNQLTFGNGWSYGAELFIKKQKGNLTGWIGYTWSKTMREFKEINNGEPYPAKYDRRHDLSITGTYKLSDRWSFGGTFVYASGKNITLPSSRYLIEGRVVSEYGPRNSYRMKPYHRADLSITFTPDNRKTKKDPETGEVLEIPRKVHSSWNLSVYNVYNRDNPYFIYFDNEGSFARGTLDVTAKQVSLFSILPSLSWNFKF